MPLIKRALVSVSNKEGIVEFARGLKALHVEILSTGGTAQLLKENKIAVIDVGDYTGQPEILNGRLKTLHPKIHGGILAFRSNPRHLKELEGSKINPIDLVVVNLYPFEETVSRKGVSFEEAIENIDIGGPTMIRAGAKNWQDVTVVVDSSDYSALLEELQRGSGQISPETNFRLAQKAFALTARYDGAIANYLTGQKDGKMPEVLSLQFEKVQDLRYGENPHQKGAFYQEGGVPSAKQIHGRELSFNNILDLDAALNIVKDFTAPTCVIIKHTNPCGVASGEGRLLHDIFIAARECDPLSAFGGIIGFNRKIDPKTAEEIGKDFYECVIAPEFDPEAFKILSAKKNIRLLSPPGLRQNQNYDLKKVVGGLLVQERDLSCEEVREAKVATKRRPRDEEWELLSFAWKVCRYVKSNAIVLAGGEGDILRTLGIGCGQMSRIDSTKIAIGKAGQSVRGSFLASDGFFPFRDNVDEAAKAGVTAIVQPGGSLKDQESIDAADQQGIAMLLTGIRHFRH